MEENAPLERKRIACLITGYVNLHLDDGGTVSLATLLGKMRRDGYQAELLCLTDRTFEKRILSSRIKQRAYTIVSEQPGRIVCRLKDHPFPLTFFPRDIDVVRAYRQKDDGLLRKAVALWRPILSSAKPDITLTTEEDVFAMSACLPLPCLRLHRISSPRIFEPTHLAYADLFRKLAPKFRFFCGSGFINRELLAVYGQKSFDLPPQVEFRNYRVNQAARKDPEFITLINGVPHKGLMVFLSLAKTLPRRKFLVRGRRAVIQPYLEENGIGNVVVDDRTEDIVSVYEKTRLLLVPSLCEDAFARVIPEAMSNGIPVIANDVGGIRTALHGGGFLARVNRKMKGRRDYTTNALYHLALMEQYLEYITLLDDPREYAEAVKRAAKAAAWVERTQNRRYREFLKWIKRERP